MNADLKLLSEYETQVPEDQDRTTIFETVVKLALKAKNDRMAAGTEDGDVSEHGCVNERLV